MGGSCAKVLVGIPTYLRPESLGRCLGALMGQTFQDFDLFINFDAPQSECLDNRGHFWLGLHRRCRAVYTHTAFHEGQVAGHNRALWDFGYNHKYILRLDDDIILNATAIENAVIRIEGDSKIGAVGGLWFDMRSGRRGQMNSEQYRHGTGLDQVDLHVQHAYFPPECFDDPVDVKHLYSACLYDANAMRACGGWAQIFSPNVAHREETEGTIRLGRSGYRLVVDPSVRGQHLWYTSGGVRAASTQDQTRRMDDRKFHQRISRLNPSFYPLKRKKLDIALFTEHVGSKRNEGRANVVGGGERLFYLTYHILSSIPELYVVPLAHGRFLSPDQAERYFGFSYKAPPPAKQQYDLQFSITHLPRCATPSVKYAGLILFPSIDQYDVSRFTNLYAISRYTQTYIHKYWGRASSIMYPPTTYPCDDKMPSKENIVLCVGRLVPFKRHIEIAGAFLSAELRGWELHIIGTTGENEKYESEVHNLARDHRNVTLHTDISDADLLSMYNRAKVLVGGMGLFASSPHSYEHWGLTQVEAMSRGVVPVMYNGGGHREPYQRYLWDSTQVLTQNLRYLAQSERERAEQASAVRTLAQKYSVDKYSHLVHRAIMESIFETTDQIMVNEAVLPDPGFLGISKGHPVFTNIEQIGKKVPELKADTLHFDIVNITNDQWEPKDTQIVARWGNGKDGALISFAPTRKIPLPTTLLPGERVSVVMPTPAPPINAGILTLHIDVLRWRKVWVNLGMSAKLRVRV